MRTGGKWNEVLYVFRGNFLYLLIISEFCLFRLDAPSLQNTSKDRRHYINNELSMNDQIETVTLINIGFN